MAKTLEVFFEPVDNARLAKLCGVLDENLRQIENAFDITVSRRGEHFTLTGHPAQVLRGEMALVGVWCMALIDMITRMALMLRRYNGGKWHAIRL